MATAGWLELGAPVVELLHRAGDVFYVLTGAEELGVGQGDLLLQGQSLGHREVGLW